MFLPSGGPVLTHWRLHGATLFWCLHAAQTSNIWRSTCVTCLTFCSYFLLLTAPFVCLPSPQTLFCFLLQQVEENQWEINLVYMRQNNLASVGSFLLKRCFHQISPNFFFFVLWSRGEKCCFCCSSSSVKSVNDRFRLGSFVFAAVAQRWIFSQAVLIGTADRHFAMPPLLNHSPQTATCTFVSVIYSAHAASVLYNSRRRQMLVGKLKTPAWRWFEWHRMQRLLSFHWFVFYDYSFYYSCSTDKHPTRVSPPLVQIDFWHIDLQRRSVVAVKQHDHFVCHWQEVTVVKLAMMS